MYRILFFLILILSSCSSFKEDNILAIPPIATDEIQITND